MNTDHVVEGLSRDISLGLQIGETQLWSALEAITISGTEEPDDPAATPKAVTVRISTSISIIIFLEVNYILNLLVFSLLSPFSNSTYLADSFVFIRPHWKTTMVKSRLGMPPCTKWMLQFPLVG